MQGIFRKENTDKALKYGIYRHLPTYEKIIRNLVSFYMKKEGKYVIFVHRRGEVKIRASLSTVEKELNSKEFIISDRGYLANIQHVMKMKGRDLYMRDGNIITVGRERFKGVREAILNYWGV